MTEQLPRIAPLDRYSGTGRSPRRALAGLWLGNRLQSRMSGAGLLRVVAVLLLLIGASLIVRALSGG